MPTIIITSDLHLGITEAPDLQRLRVQLDAAQPDLTVLAGDLGEPLHYFQECLQIFAHLPGATAVLAGNHDVWSSKDHTSRDLWERHLPASTQSAGMIWLEATTWRLGSLAVVGSLAWYDYSGADPVVTPRSDEDFQLIKRLLNNDARYINWSWSDREFADRLGESLKTRLHLLEADPEITDVVVVTHVPLVEAQLVRRPADTDWGLSNAFFGNLTTGERVWSFAKLRAIISGHTHMGRQATMERPGLAPVLTAVVPSDYGKPAALVLDTATWSLSMVR